MATGRTSLRWCRVYVDGYDLSGYARKVGPLMCEFENQPDAALSDAVKNVMVGQANLGIGELNGFFDNTASVGLHVAFSGNLGQKRTVLIPIGIQAAPAQGDPAFAGDFEHLSYDAKDEPGFMVANLKFGNA